MKEKESVRTFLRSWRSGFLISLVLTGTAVFGGTRAQFRTAFGDIEVELYDQDKPVTVQNFIRYVQSGAYQNEFAHRLVPGFVIQGGGFTITNRGTTNSAIATISTFPPIVNEFSVGHRYSNVYGTIAMAKLGGNTNSATSQWFFNLVNNTFLDANDTNNLFVVFGHVIQGTNILNTFNSFQYYTNTSQTTDIVLHQYYAPPFDDLPLLRPALYDTNFVYLDITLIPSLSIQKTNQSVLLSWPAWATNFNLQAAEIAQGNSGGWTNVAAAVTVTNNIRSVTLPMTGSEHYYRLRQ
jgi:cyclophilin family peptidyl-prolyl cis-trans isomerase